MSKRTANNTKLMTDRRTLSGRMQPIFIAPVITATILVLSACDPSDDALVVTEFLPIISEPHYPTRAPNTAQLCLLSSVDCRSLYSRAPTTCLVTEECDSAGKLYRLPSRSGGDT